MGFSSFDISNYARLTLQFTFSWQFDALTHLLLEIDPVVHAEAEDRARRGQLKGGNAVTQEENLLSRVELIERTVEVLRRVHKENQERKLIIEHLLQQKSQNPTPGLLNAALSSVRTMHSCLLCSAESRGHLTHFFFIVTYFLFRTGWECKTVDLLRTNWRQCLPYQKYQLAK